MDCRTSHCRFLASQKRTADAIPIMATRTATTMIAARPPFEMLKAPLEAPAAPASSGSGGLSSPPLYPGDWGVFEFCAAARRGRRAERRMERIMVENGYQNDTGVGSGDGRWYEGGEIM